MSNHLNKEENDVKRTQLKNFYLIDIYSDKINIFIKVIRARSLVII